MAEWPVLDVGYDYGAVGGPAFNTNIVVSASGFEKRQAPFRYPRGRWQLGERMIDEVRLEKLLTFFNAVRGQWGVFNYKDWNDWTAVKDPPPGESIYSVGGGEYLDANRFMLTKEYTIMAVGNTLTTVRRIFSPVASTLNVWLDGSPATITSVEPQTGIITVAETITTATVIRAEFDFYVPARFGTDEFSATFEGYEEGKRAYFLSSLPVVEILPY